MVYVKFRCFVGGVIDMSFIVVIVVMEMIFLVMLFYMLFIVINIQLFDWVRGQIQRIMGYYFFIYDSGM